MTSSTPDALWAAPALRALRPSAITCTDLVRGPLLNGCSLAVPVGHAPARRGRAGRVGLDAGAHPRRAVASAARPNRDRGPQRPTADGWGRRVAYLGPEPGIHAWMTPREALELAARLLRLPATEAARRIERALAWVRISAEAADRPVGRSGPPLLQRTGLAAALIADPEVLILDEPLRALEAHERARLLRLPGRGGRWCSPAAIRQARRACRRTWRSCAGGWRCWLRPRAGGRGADALDAGHRRPRGDAAPGCAPSRQAPARHGEPGRHRGPARHARAVDDVPAAARADRGGRCRCRRRAPARAAGGGHGSAGHRPGACVGGGRRGRGVVVRRGATLRARRLADHPLRARALPISSAGTGH